MAIIILSVQISKSGRVIHYLDCMQGDVLDRSMLETSGSPLSKRSNPVTTDN